MLTCMQTVLVVLLLVLQSHYDLLQIVYRLLLASCQQQQTTKMDHLHRDVLYRPFWSNFLFRHSLSMPSHIILLG